MMFVNKYRVTYNPSISQDDINISIPIRLDYQLVDQNDIVNSEFVDVEIKKNINDILDYERVRFQPKLSTNDGIILTNTITYNVNFLNQNNNYNQYTYYGDIGFDDFDIKFRKKRFTDSFLRLSFYDSDITTNQRLISFVTLYPKIEPNNYSIGQSWGEITPANNFKIQFTLSSSLIDRTLNSQGYFLYHYKDEVSANSPKELYMRAEFNNAKNGKTTNFMSNSDPTITIDNLIVTTTGSNNENNLFTKYILKKVNNSYYYEIDTSYSTNVQILNGDYIVNLYQISAA
jgi:hypothetical protein